MREIVFLTGLPRSGTKLLRDLLNNHSLISIPIIETVLIPYLVRKFGTGFDLSDRANFNELCSSFKESTFYNSYKNTGRDIEPEGLFDKLEKKTWTSFFEEILKFYGPKPYSVELIIGDKTPGYIDHTDLLLSLWPKAKIVHIVRDPRDYVCSVNKVWNKNIYRAADRWNQTMNKLSSSQLLDNSNYLEVYYESLLDEPEQVLTEICRFLGIEFEPDMLQLKRSSENFGDARGQTSIVRANKQKYRKNLSQRQIQKIEQLVQKAALDHGYSLDNQSLKPRDLSRLDLTLLKAADGFNAWGFHIKRRGFVKGTKYFFQLHRENIK